MLFVRLLFISRNTTANAIIGKTNDETLTLKPKREIIQAVKVVPTLAPIITAIDCPKVIRPAFTKLTTITVELMSSE